MDTQIKLCKCGEPIDNPEHSLCPVCWAENQQKMNMYLLESVPKKRASVFQRLAGADDYFSRKYGKQRSRWPEACARALAEAKQELERGDADAARARAEGTPGAFAPAKFHLFRVGELVTTAYYENKKAEVAKILADLDPRSGAEPLAKVREAIAAFRVAEKKEGRQRTDGLEQANALMKEALTMACGASDKFREEMRNSGTVRAAVGEEVAAEVAETVIKADKRRTVRAAKKTAEQRGEEEEMKDEVDPETAQVSRVSHSSRRPREASAEA